MSALGLGSPCERLAGKFTGSCGREVSGFAMLAFNRSTRFFVVTAGICSQFTNGRSVRKCGAMRVRENSVQLVHELAAKLVRRLEPRWI